MFSFYGLFISSLPLLILASPLAANQEPIAPTRASSFAPTTWQHPGYVVDKVQLDFMKAQVASGAAPWTAAYAQMLKDSDKYGRYVSGTRTSETVSSVSCGPTTNPDIKCTDERGDALAAWGNALAWYVSGDASYAKNAIALMNKWSYVIKGKLLLLCSLQSCQIVANYAYCSGFEFATRPAWLSSDCQLDGDLTSRLD